MRRLLAPLAALALAGCWVPAERGRQMERRIERLEQEDELTSRQLDEQRELIRDRVAKVDAKIAEVQKKLDELNATAHRTGADVVARQDQLQQDLAVDRGRLEALEEQLRQQRSELDAKFAALRGQGALEQYEARQKASTLKRPADPQGMLALAQEQERAGEKGVARELYDELVKKWPKDPAAAEAHFRLGELAAAEGKHREAVLAFGKVAQEYPRSERAPDAMLRTGDSLAALGMKPEAVAVLRELQTKYPGSPAARTAKQRVDELEPPRRPAAKKRQ